jgi:hypothetical protein
MISMESSVVSKNRPRLEVSFRSFRLAAEELEAIRVVRWPVAGLLIAFAAVIVIVALRSHPIDVLTSLIAHFIK